MDKKFIWMRLGITVEATKEQVETILQGDESADEVLLELLKSHSYHIDGNTYIPSSEVEVYNEENGTDFEVGDLDFDFYEVDD